MNLKLMKNLNALYVEDDPIVAEQTRTLLENYFSTVYYCSNAEDGLKVLEEQPVHLLITDIELPGMNGLELCETIRKSNNQMPIFITTMHNHKDLLMKAVKLNLVDYLVKPITVSNITESLSESLERLYQNGQLEYQINKTTFFYPMQDELKKDGQTVSLTMNEAKLLQLLFEHKNQVVDKTTIEHTVHPDEPMSDSAYKNLIYRLR
ncbi:MAG: DNA-binding response regulator, partial [Sulfurimonadaceae bacterium]|nr:DNA-binding response regulator [Sulfurimonadaceae bacterium]